MEYFLIFCVVDLLLYFITPYKKYRRRFNHRFKMIIISGYIVFTLWMIDLYRTKKYKYKSLDDLISEFGPNPDYNYFSNKIAYYHINNIISDYTYDDILEYYGFL